MTLRDEQKQRQQQASAEMAAERRRLGAVALETFSTGPGRDLFNHLAKRFEVLGRTFTPGESGSVCPLRGAIRDGEKSVVLYLYNLIREVRPDFLLIETAETKNPTRTTP